MKKLLNLDLYGFAVKWILIAVAALYLVSSYSFSFWPFDSQREVIEQLEGEQNVTEAQVETAKATVKTVLDNADENKAIDEVVKEAAASIDAADPEAEPEVTRKAVRSAVCQMAIYANDPQCQEDVVPTVDIR